MSRPVQRGLEAAGCRGPERLDRAALPPPPAPAANSDRDTGAPRGRVEAELCRIWADVLDLARVRVDENFFDLGGTSTQIVQLAARVQGVFGRLPPYELLVQVGTVERMARWLEEEAARPSDRIISLRAGDGTPPLVVIHPGGGTAAVYIELVRRLTADVQVTGVQAAGFASNTVEGGDEALEELAGQYLALLPEDELRRSVLGGFSFGALMALEMARRYLASSGRSLPLLLIDPPVFVGARPPWEPADPATFWHHRYASRIDLGLDELRACGSEVTMLARIVESMERLGTFPRHLYWADVDVIVRLVIQRRTTGAAWRYRPGTYAGPSALFLAAGTTDYPFRSRFWRRRGLGSVATRVVEADHRGVMQPPGVDALARAVDEVLPLLAAASGGSAGTGAGR